MHALPAAILAGPGAPALQRCLTRLTQLREAEKAETCRLRVQELRHFA